MARARCFTIRLPVRRVNAEVRTSFPGHHINATFELRGGGVKAAARRVERSESLDADEHSVDPGHVVADVLTNIAAEDHSRLFEGLRRLRARERTGNRPPDRKENTTRDRGTDVGRLHGSKLS